MIRRTLATIRRTGVRAGLLFGLVAALATPAAVPAAAQEPQLRREFNVAPGQRLEIHLETGGKISVTGWEREVVAVDARKSGRDCDLIAIEAEQRGSSVLVESEMVERANNIRCSLEIDVRVPSRFDVEVETMGGGVAITGVEGELSGQTMGGGLTLTRLRGRVDLTTMGGDIELTDSEVDGRVHTMGGRVRIEDVVGDVKGSSMGGNVVYRRVTDRAGKGSGDEVRINTMGGSINVDDAPAGANVETMGGTVRVTSARGHVRAKTMGGDIDLGAVDGWIEATTMGGDIEARMTGDPAQGDRHVTLVSMSGDVTLEVPAGLDMQIDITLAYTRNSRGNYRITSDFPLQQTETDAWDEENGSPRKYIYGNSTIGAGTHRIRIETVNGNITLRRAPSR